MRPHPPTGATGGGASATTRPVVDRLAGGHFPRRRPRRSRGRSRGRAPSRRRACRRGLCACAKRKLRCRRSRRRPGDSHRFPSPLLSRRHRSGDGSARSPRCPWRSGSPGRRKVRTGPQSGQATVWAWNRRLAGSAYSAAHAEHNGSSAIVVIGRSYGRSTTTVKRGPQLVQLMKGCRYRRSAGSASSARQASQVAMSGETSVRPGPCRDGWMTNSVPPRQGICCAVTVSTWARTGASGPSRRRNSATTGAAPSTSTITPSAALPTDPDRPSSRASA